MAHTTDVPVFGALQGVKVFDTGSNIAGPFAGGLMAENGATVVHLESPNAPDNTRGFYGWPQNHRNQLSLVADITKPEGKKIFLKMIKWADIWMESSKGGTYDSWGLSDEVIWKHNPKIAIVHTSGFGQSGVPSYVKRASYDAVGQAFSGYMSLNGTDVPMKVNPYISDYVTGLNTCWAALACYIKAKNTGHGESVDISQFESLARIMDQQPMQYLNDGVKMPRTGNKDNLAATFSFYTCKDGGVVFVGMTGNGPVKRGYPIIGLPLPGKDPKGEIWEGFTGWMINTPLGQRLETALEKYCSEHDAAEVEAVFQKNQIPCQRVYGLEDCEADPHWKAREVFTEWDDPAVGHVKGLGLTHKFKNDPGQIWRGAPLFGTDNEDILSELGYTPEEIKSLYKKHVLGKMDRDQYVARYRLEQVIPRIAKEDEKAYAVAEAEAQANGEK